MTIFIIEHREHQAHSVCEIDSTVIHVSSTIEKSIDWCTNNTDAMSPGSKYGGHSWFVIYPAVIDNCIGESSIIFGVNGIQEQQPFDGYVE